RRLPLDRELADDLPTHWGKETRPRFAFPRPVRAAKDSQQRSRFDSPIGSPKPGICPPLPPSPPIEIQPQAILRPRQCPRSLSFEPETSPHKVRLVLIPAFAGEPRSADKTTPV